MKYCFLIVICFLIACENTHKPVPFSLTGTLQNCEDGVVYLKDLNSIDRTIVDSVYLNKGVFSFHKPVKEKGFYQLVLPQKTYINLILDTIGEVSLTGDFKNIVTTLKAVGNDDVKQMIDLEKGYAKFKQFIDSLKQADAIADSKEDLDAIDSAFKIHQKAYHNELVNHINKYPQSLTIYWALTTQFGDLKLFQHKTDFNYYKTVDSLLMLYHKESVHSINLHQWVTKAQQKLNEQKMIQERLKTGNPAPEIILTNMEEKEVKLTDFKNNYVLIQFWGSWDKKSLRDIDLLKKNYPSYKSKKLEIIGISLDEKTELWTDISIQKQIDWVNLLSTPITNKVYNIHYNNLPQYYVLDKSGLIIFKDNKIESVISKIDSIFAH